MAMKWNLDGTLQNTLAGHASVTVHIPPAFEREIKGYGDLAKGGVNYYTQALSAA